jgi:crossover junction endodeoxyribonuclease RuvC
VLTLDLARHCGWAYVLQECPHHPGLPQVAACGTIDIGAHTVKRWINLEAHVKGVIETYRPDLIIIEENFIFKNVKTTAALNQLRGAVLLLAALKGVAVGGVNNKTAKKHMLGSTNYWDGTKYVSVTKDMMKDAVCKALCDRSIPPHDHDSADAIALALTYYETPVPDAGLARKPKDPPRVSRSKRLSLS